MTTLVRLLLALAALTHLGGAVRYETKSRPPGSTFAGDGGGGGGGGVGVSSLDTSPTTSTDEALFRRVALSAVQTLTLSADTLTTGRNPVPQLRCTDGSAQGRYQLTGLACVALSPITAFDGDDVHWKCTAPDLPHEFVLGATTVSCESYDPAVTDTEGHTDTGARADEAEWIIDGSCAVEYSLHLSESGERRFSSSMSSMPSSPATPLQDSTHGSSLPDPNRGGAKGDGPQSWFSILFWVLFIGTATTILYRVATGSSAPDSRPAARGPNGFRDDGGAAFGTGGNDGDGDDDNGGFGGPGSGQAGASTGSFGRSGDGDAWSPINPHSTLFQSRVAQRTQNYGMTNTAMDRRQSDIAPALERSASPAAGSSSSSASGLTFDSSRPVTSFGGTTRR